MLWCNGEEGGNQDLRLLRVRGGWCLSMIKKVGFWMLCWVRGVGIEEQREAKGAGGAAMIKRIGMRDFDG